MMRHGKTMIKNELVVKINNPKEDLTPDGDSKNYCLEHESNLENERDSFAIVDQTPMTVMMLSQKGKIPKISTQPKNNAPTCNSTQTIILSTSSSIVAQMGNIPISFDIVKFFEDSTI